MPHTLHSLPVAVRESCASACGLPVRGRAGNNTCVTWYGRPFRGFLHFPWVGEGVWRGLHSGIQAYRRGALHCIEVLCCILCRGWMAMVCQKDGKNKPSGSNKWNGDGFTKSFDVMGEMMCVESAWLECVRNSDNGCYDLPFFTCFSFFSFLFSSPLYQPSSSSHLLLVVARLESTQRVGSSLRIHSVLLFIPLVSPLASRRGDTYSGTCQYPKMGLSLLIFTTRYTRPIHG